MSVARFSSRLCLVLLLWPLPGASAGLHHELDVVIRPAQHEIEVTDTITLPEADAGRREFALHPVFKPELLTPGARLSVLGSRTAGHEDLSPARYRVQLPPGTDRFTLRYRGAIRHTLRQQGGEYVRGYQETPGTISDEGVFLAGSSYWYPHTEGELVSFDLRITLPGDWSGMTQGSRMARTAGPENASEHWHCKSPQEEIYLIAGAFSEYTQDADGVEAMVLLREPDVVLARKYLDATAAYLRLYAGLIGPYPYGKFALVENFWETGYGMPSFTLLGSKVIRFPFILHSSYPHEILHNWWGNGVYVDYERGNWAEGLTSYLADHLLKEQQGQGVNYRRTALQKYTDHVRHRQDFPLTAFRARHSAVTEAVGYGKTLMLFHMLRQELGDDAFIEGLHALYRQYRFERADFAAVENIFSSVAGRSLRAFFDQWVERRGAPVLEVTRAIVKPTAGSYMLTMLIRQVQDGMPYALRVPVAIHLEGKEAAFQTDLRIERRQQTVELDLPARPWRLDVDPEFDVFRRLHRSEVPPAISQAMGAEQSLIVLPADAPKALRVAYAALATNWQAGNPDSIGVVYDSELEELPGDRAVWLFGWENRFRAQLSQALAAYAFEDQAGAVRIEDTTVQRDGHSVVVLARNRENPEHALGWLATGQAGALPGLGRKIPHYGRYSYLAFSGEAPTNVLKGQWPVVDSPLSVAIQQADGAAVMPGSVRLATRTPLIQPRPDFSGKRMLHDIRVLSDAGMQGRGLGSDELDRVADYIAAQLKDAGLQPGGSSEGSWLQVWQESVAGYGRELTLQNVIGVLPGSDPDRAGESLVIGAHYDHLGLGESGAHAGDEGRVHPGADDNASGIAVLLELARKLAGRPQPRSIVFVAFTGEEAGRLGSRHYLETATDYPAGKIMAMLNLDTVGRLGGRPLTVFGTDTAAEWVHILRGAGYVTGVPVQTVDDDIGSSDQTSFIAAGVPAVQLFGGVHEDYHRPGDTHDKIDAEGLVKVARVLQEAVAFLAERPQSLDSRLQGKQTAAAASATQPQRRASLGTVPDYGYSGEGLRITGVRAGSPAEQAGLRQGDIILSVNGSRVDDLREYAQVLRGLVPGDSVAIRFRRDDTEHQVSTRAAVR